MRSICRGLQLCQYLEADLHSQLVTKLRGLCVQVRGEAFVPWRAPRRRMKPRSGSRLKRPRSPQRQRGEESSDRGAEETATEEEERERRTKQRHDPRFAARSAKEKGPARTPPKRKRRVVDLSSGEEEKTEERGEEFDLEAEIR